MDAKDLYGKSKIVGEIERKNKSLIRSSIIGPEEGKGFSLMNWFLKMIKKRFLVTKIIYGMELLL